MVIVKLKKGETTARLIARFQRLVHNEGVMEEMEKRQFFQDKTTKRLLKEKKENRKRPAIDF